jgi:hypothetical protein
LHILYLNDQLSMNFFAWNIFLWTCDSELKRANVLFGKLKSPWYLSYHSQHDFFSGYTFKSLSSKYNFSVLIVYTDSNYYVSFAFSIMLYLFFTNSSFLVFQNIHICIYIYIMYKY